MEQDQDTNIRNLPSMNDRSSLERWLAADGANTEPAAFRNSAFWACITLIADSVAQLPRRLYRQNPAGDKSILTTHPVARLLARPSEDLNAFVWWRTMVLWLAGWGSAYAVIERSAQGVPIGLIAIPPDYVSHRDRASDPYLVTMPEGGSVTIRPGNMFHAMGYSIDGVNGLSPIRQHKHKVEQSNLQESYGAAFWRKGAKISGVLEAPGKISPTVATALRTQFGKVYGAGGEREGGTALLDNGLKYHSIAPISPQDADYVAARRMGTIETCQIYRVPPIFIGMLEGATYDRVEGLNTFFVRHTLGPYFEAIESEAMHKLIRRGAAGKLAVEHDPNRFLRLSGKERTEAQARAVMGGIISPNEARAEDHRPPKPGGDELWRPANVTALTEQALDGLTVARVAKPSQPPAEAEGDSGDDPATRLWDVAARGWI